MEWRWPKWPQVEVEVLQVPTARRVFHQELSKRDAEALLNQQVFGVDNQTQLALHRQSLRSCGSETIAAIGERPDPLAPELRKVSSLAGIGHGRVNKTLANRPAVILTIERRMWK